MGLGLNPEIGFRVRVVTGVWVRVANGVAVRIRVRVGVGRTSWG